ncbi:MAG: ABC transporter permease [Chlamydiales bacterium]|nr:ABC transporter permease [Chlamydiales bacterium]
MTTENILLALRLIPVELLSTLYMVILSTFIALLFGLPLGVLLTITHKGHISEHPLIHKILGYLINIGRSFPFAILMVALIPFTRWIVGTSLGTSASIVPLSIAAIPAVARAVEIALRDVEKSVIEASLVMGSTRMQIITKVLLPEALAPLILGVTTIVIHLIGYSAMAGLMGGGGLGKIAIQYGYYQFNLFLMSATVIVLIILVQCIQWLGASFATHIYKTRGKLISR